jgi:DNA-binding HxlR family transcriptional regulator
LNAFINQRDKKIKHSDEIIYSVIEFSTTMRSYDEYCAIAKSLDVVGDRWTLLIVRELSLRGACRYTDLRNGLPGIATNLLAERLRELERAGVVTREDAPPPVATALFRLTPRGEQLRPVLEDLVRWGVPLMTDQRPTDAVRSHWLVWALELMLTDRRPSASPVTVRLETGDQPIVFEARDGAISARLDAAGESDRVDATISGPPRPILGLLLGLLGLADAEAGGVEFRGDRAILDRFGSELTATAG